MQRLSLHTTLPSHLARLNGSILSKHPICSAQERWLTSARDMMSSREQQHACLFAQVFCRLYGTGKSFTRCATPELSQSASVPVRSH